MVLVVLFSGIFISYMYLNVKKQKQTKDYFWKIIFEIHL